MSRRALTFGGIAAAGGVGYYFYQAGGDPKVARKEAEHDLATAKSKVKGETVSNEAAKKQGEEWAARAGSQIDRTVDDARAKAREADKVISNKTAEAENKVSQLKSDGVTKFDQTRKDAGRKIDEIDSKVEKKASEAKSGISSWFGFGK
ncbi:MAG: hypothetical protein OHK93_000371 [Ramalina farinacea]|uniref:Calcofluor white hypersensitive protein n=1 Tax=Ramalina farinacea TaxID=258253 RepID=A0AA43TRQ9_9LECA|nr:hypothetical protein [Ramalina farinacea]